MEQAERKIGKGYERKETPDDLQRPDPAIPETYYLITIALRFQEPFDFPHPFLSQFKGEFLSTTSQRTVPLENPALTEQGETSPLRNPRTGGAATGTGSEHY